MLKIDKEVLFNFINSHRYLITNEFHRNLDLTVENKHNQAGVRMIEALRESGWLEEFYSWEEENG